MLIVHFHIQTLTAQMIKAKKTTDHRSAHGSVWAGALGGAVGTGLGSVLGPELAILGGLIGNGIGGSLGFIFGASPSSGEDADQTINMLKQKLHMDYELSVLHDRSQFNEAHSKSVDRVRLISEARSVKIMEVASNKGAEWLLREMNSITEMSTRLAIPDEIKRGSDVVKASQNRIHISCQSISAACVATLKSLAHPDRLALPIDIDFSDTCGAYQVSTVASCKGRFDFVITANAPLAFAASTLTPLRDYRLLFEIHGNEQLLLKRKSLFNKKIKQVHIFSNSSAEEQVITSESLFLNCHRQEHSFYEDLRQITESLDTDECVIAWEPLASRLVSIPGIKPTGVKYLNWISLFSHKRIMSYRLAKFKEAFMKLFVYEWLHCSRNKGYALNLLLDDAAFVERFGIAACTRSNRRIQI
jgi:hypothetical protein